MPIVLGVLGAIGVIFPPRSLEAELEEYERADPTRTDVLAWSAAAWLASLSLLRALEAVLFAWLIVVVLFRFRASLRVLRAAFWTPPFLLVFAYLVWTAIATLAYGRENMWELTIPERRFLIPLLLVPVLHRWRLLLLGLIAGGALEVAIMMVRAALRSSVWPELSTNLVDGTQWTLVVLVAAGTFAMFVARGRVRMVGGILAGLALVFQGALTQRAPFVGSLAAVVAVAVIGWQFFSRRTRLVVGFGAPLLLGMAVGVSGRHMRSAMRHCSGMVARRGVRKWIDSSTLRQRKFVRNGAPPSCDGPARSGTRITRSLTSSSNRGLLVQGYSSRRSSLGSEVHSGDCARNQSR